MPNCGPCARVKDWLNAQPEPIELEILGDPKEFPATIRSVPTLEVDGKFLTGDHPIIQMLKEKQREQAN